MIKLINTYPHFQIYSKGSILLNDQIEQLLTQIIEQSDIEITDIPKIDLYMDQVITLFDSNVGTSKRYPEDKLLTKTMINNYTKDKILMPAKNKKYTPEHIAQMALIYHLKQSLQIGDIKNLFQATLHHKDVNVWAVYEQFLANKKVQLSNTNEQIKTQFADDESKLNPKEQTLLTVLSLIQQANTYKRLAEKLIDQLDN
ncbi:DUF1836 domain-containing protein [Paenibacillus albiflavus]|uniref:DUF1836 domain-containing protein n=1 Tax=Paenibacillus albiflavus TaxID=2545760 RepID=A0A4R4DYW1_9BACL|nr:DUF1836 domain-containing protein [Paenibacillus albiflavus]